MYHVVEGESVTVTVGVMNDVILDRNMFVNVQALGEYFGGTATYGTKLCIFMCIMYTCTCLQGMWLPYLSCMWV